MYQEINSLPKYERGSALFIALALIIIFSFLAFGLLCRAAVSSRIAGLERWPIKTFYAADSGITAARARLRVRAFSSFEFKVADRRGRRGRATGLPITVDVSQLLPLGPPRPETGFQIGGGQGSGAVALYTRLYRGQSRATLRSTGSSRKISASISLGPVPLSPQEKGLKP